MVQSLDYKKIKFAPIKTISFNRIKFKKENYYRGIVLTKKKISILKFPSLKDAGINVFEQLQPSEPQHSMILGTLLNPNGKHPFGDIFLRSFFSTIIDDCDFLYDDKEQWIVEIETGRFDVSIKNKNNTKIIIIENKSNGAQDQPNQLYRYWLNGIYKPQYNFIKYGRPTFAKLIYLSPSFEKQYTGQSITRPETETWDIDLPMTVPKEIIKTVYFSQEIVTWLEKCMESVDKTEDMYFYIKQYRDFWR